MAVQKLFDYEAFAKAVQDSKLAMPEIAAQVGCSVSDIYRYIRGDTTPRMERLKKMVELFGPAISGLALTGSASGIRKRFSIEEQRFLTFFTALPPFRQAFILGWCESVFAYGRRADPEFAAVVAEHLVHDNQQRQGHTG